MNELREALDWYATQPCAECGDVLGKNWTERYDATTDRDEAVHESSRASARRSPGRLSVDLDTHCGRWNLSLR